MGESDEKKVLKSDVIAGSLLLFSGLFDDEPEGVVETVIPAEQEAGIKDENGEGSSDDAMDAGFSVTVDDEGTVSDTRKAQLEEISYFLKPEPIPKIGKSGKKEKLEPAGSPKISLSGPLDGRVKRPSEVKSDKPKSRSNERSRMDLGSREDLTGIRSKDIKITMAIREMKSGHKQGEVAKKQDAEGKRIVFPQQVKRTVPVKAMARKVKNKGLMSMDLGVVKPGMDMRSMMDLEMEINARNDGMKEYFRR